MVYPFKSYKMDVEQNLATNNRSTGTYSELEKSDTSTDECSPSMVGSLTSTKKRHFKIIDETLLHPEEAKLLLAKRAYNRECANRARKRKKELMKDLQKKIDDLQKDKSQLRRAVYDMEAKLRSIQIRNNLLQAATVQLRYNPNIGANATYNRREGIPSKNLSSTEFVTPYSTNSDINLFHRRNQSVDALGEL